MPAHSKYLIPITIIIVLIKKEKLWGLLKDHNSKKEKKQAKHTQGKMHLCARFCWGSPAITGTQQPDFIHGKTFKEPEDRASSIFFAVK